MYQPKQRVNLSSLFKLKVRKRQPVVFIDYKDGRGLHRLKGVTSFTPPVMN